MSGEEQDKPAERATKAQPSEAADAERPRKLDALMKRLKRNPRFRVGEGSGEGFIIGGFQSAPPKRGERADAQSGY
jgi:hypothetical protein